MTVEHMLEWADEVASDDCTLSNEQVDELVVALADAVRCHETDTNDLKILLAYFKQEYARLVTENGELRMGLMRTCATCKHSIDYRDELWCRTGPGARSFAGLLCRDVGNVCGAWEKRDG